MRRTASLIGHYLELSFEPFLSRSTSGETYDGRVAISQPNSSYRFETYEHRGTSPQLPQLRTNELLKYFFATNRVQV
jgi:hypothetical protein